MPYTNGDGTYHDRRRCRRLHNTGGRIRRVEAGNREACGWCVDDGQEPPEPQVASVADLLDDGRCPWCDDYDGDHVGQHASSAHPEAWADYKSDD